MAAFPTDTEFWLTPAKMIWQFILMCFGNPYLASGIHTLSVGFITLIFWASVIKFLIMLLYKLLGLNGNRGQMR
jgi:uncharacterized membrane protein